MLFNKHRLEARPTDLNPATAAEDGDDGLGV